MSAFGFELKQAVRRVFTWKQTGAILIPAIGLTLATIMFAVGWGYSTHSLPYKDAGQLVRIGYVYPDSSQDDAGFLDAEYQPFFDWKERKDVFVDVAAERRMSDLWMYMTVKSDNGSVRLDIREVTANFFDVLGVSFPGIAAWKATVNVKNPKTVVFLHKTGVNKFGHESMGKLFPSPEGNGIIPIGILPQNFVLPITYGGDNSDWAFTPMELKPGDNANYQQSQIMNADGSPSGIFSKFSRDPLYVYARLAPGVTPQLAGQMLAGSSGVYTNVQDVQQRLSIVPLADILTKQSKPIVRYAWALCALILVLCAANLGGIILARCTYGLREYALRSALGASLSNLVRTLLLELFGIAVIAALAAAFIARSAMPAIADRVPIRHEAFGRTIFGREAVIFLLAATAAVMLASALPSIVVIIRNYYKGFSSGILAVFRSHRALRIVLTASQTAVATLLLCLSWMTVRGYSDIFFRDTGVDAKTRVISVYYPPPQGKEQAAEFDFDALNVLRGGNPDARAAGFYMSDLSLFKGRRSLGNLLAFEKMMLERDPTYKENQSFEMLWVTVGFFKTLGVKIVAGRDFNDSDLVGRETIVNEALVRKMGWTPWEAVGRETYGGTIIGVCGDFLTGSWDSVILPELYAPMTRERNIRLGSGVTLYYIIHPDDLRRAGNIEKAIRSADPDVRITQIASWGEMLGMTVRGRSFATFCVALFTIAGIAIVVTGIVSTITFIVARRTRDIAIQIAVGAPPYRVCWFVMKDMVIAGIIGSLAGGLASWWAGKAVAHYVYNGEKYQNLTGLAIAAAIMLVIIAAAALLPALRALRVEPGSILNKE